MMCIATTLLSEKSHVMSGPLNMFEIQGAIPTKINFPIKAHFKIFICKLPFHKTDTEG